MAEATESIVKYNGDIQALASSMGLMVDILNENYAIMYLTAEQIAELRESPQVEYIEPQKLLALVDTPAMVGSCVSAVQHAPSSLSGKGVLIATLDSGIDYMHNDFRNDDGTTRILSMWDQNATGTPPQGFSIGAEFSEQDINEAIRNNTPLPTDQIGHGTAVAGAAAGNGRSSNGDYKGAAPEASLLIIKLANNQTPYITSDTNLMRGIKYAIDKAIAFNMPLVINISYGTNLGSHDGSSLFEQYINTMADRWKTSIVIPTGNEGISGKHFMGTVQTGSSIDAQFTLQAGNLETINLTLFKYFVDDFELQIIDSSGRTSGSIFFSTALQTFVVGTAQISISVLPPTPYNNDEVVSIIFSGLAGNPLPENIWNIRIKGRIILNGQVNIWIPVTEASGAGTRFLNPTQDITLTIPSTVPNAISVGGYNSADNTFADFSGRGFSRSGDVKPDLCAPAVNVLSTSIGGGYGSFTGTSFAGPIVAGSCALLMQWGIVNGNDTYLYGQRLKSFLVSGVIEHTNMTFPNTLWGYGALCTKNALDNAELYVLTSAVDSTNPQVQQTSNIVSAMAQVSTHSSDAPTQGTENSTEGEGGIGAGGNRAEGTVSNGTLNNSGEVNSQTPSSGTALSLPSTNASQSRAADNTPNFFPGFTRSASQPGGRTNGVTGSVQNGNGRNSAGRNNGNSAPPAPPLPQSGNMTPQNTAGSAASQSGNRTNGVTGPVQNGNGRNSAGRNNGNSAPPVPPRPQSGNMTPQNTAGSAASQSGNRTNGVTGPVQNSNGRNSAGRNNGNSAPPAPLPPQSGNMTPQNTAGSVDLVANTPSSSAESLSNGTSASGNTSNTADTTDGTAPPATESPPRTQTEGSRGGATQPQRAVDNTLTQSPWEGAIPREEPIFENSEENPVLNEKYYNFIIRYDDLTKEEIANHSWIVVSALLNSSFAIIQIPADREKDFFNIRPAIYYERSIICGLMANQALDASGISAVKNQQFLNLTGAGVLVGIVDTGVDYLVDTLKYENGRSKVVSLWDQGIQDGPPPDGFVYGTEYSNEEINDAIKSDNPESIVPSTDEIGHGTFLASLIAGRQTPDHDEGAAPSADIIAVRLKQASEAARARSAIFDNEVPAYESSDIMTGVEYVFRKARQLGKPVIICLGIGSSTGQHDALSFFEQYLTDICVENGVGICCSVGNEGAAAHHAAGRLTQVDEMQLIEFNVSENNRGFLLNLWAFAPDRVSISITTPQGGQIERRRFIENESISYEFVLEGSRVIIDYTFPSIKNGDQAIYIRFIDPQPGLWTLRVYADLIVDGRYNMWMPISPFLDSETYFLNPNINSTVTIPSTSHSLIGVGGYNSQDGGIFVSTGRGPTVDGHQCPELVAPAVNVAGVRPGGFSTTMTGTSVASAITAGASVLLMQWGYVNGNDAAMNTLKIRVYLLLGCRQKVDLDYPNELWGYGELDLMQTFNRLNT